MAVKTMEFEVRTRGFCQLEDVTNHVRDALAKSGLLDGIACVAVAGSTAGVSTLEYEPGLLQDVPEFMESVVPSKRRYHHDDTWQDGNGFSHVRSFLLKTSHCVPFSGGELLLGTWQQIVLADFDNRPRSRRVFVQLVGE
jgi:secondary thiamine-phosphate synthase enzyme